MGVRKIVTFATLEIGGYAWARFGFTADKKEEMEVILNNAATRISATEYKWALRVFDNYYDQYPNGSAFPIIKWSDMAFMKDVLLGARWHGSLDLFDSEQFNTFIMYVFQ